METKGRAAPEEIMPRICIADLRINMSLRRQLFLLRDAQLSGTRGGGTMLRVTLADRSGTIAGVLFDAPSHIASSLTTGGGVEITGRVSEYRDELQVAIERIAPAELDDLSEFLPVARRPMAAMLSEFDALRASIQNPDLAGLLKVLWGGAETYRAFTQAPAAKSLHHACVGGLLEHTLCVAHLVLSACEIYPELDRDLALTVALLHDLGKVRAYDPRSFNFTPEGEMWGHLYMGASQVEHAIDQMPDFDGELRWRVVHALLAHHGKLEYGSPVLPKTLEALVLHAADMMDGDTRGALDQLERSEGDAGAFTRHSTMHDTRLFRGTGGSGSELTPSRPS